MVSSRESNVALQAVPRESIEGVVESITSNYEVIPLELPEAGLYLLQLEDGVSSEPFYAGEISAARAMVRLKDDGGSTYDGAAVIMKDDAILAQWVAVCDSVLSHRLSGHEEVSELVREGLELRREEDRIRQAILASTAVDFSLLEEVEEAAE